jgi:hypothetical protein
MEKAIDVIDSVDAVWLGKAGGEDVEEGGKGNKC